MIREPAFERVLEFDLGSVEASLAGPSRPESLVRLADAPERFRTAFAKLGTADAAAPPVAAASRPLQHGDIAIASIASCTNTANPFQMIAAGLIARNAVAKGLRTKPWIKTSFSPGSRVVPAMLAKAGLSDALDALGFHLVGFGCMACGSGSGGVAEPIAAEIAARDLVAVGPTDLHSTLPQFRRAPQRFRARHVPRLAAPRGGVRDRRIDPDRSDVRKTGRRRGRTAGLSCGYLARRRGDPRLPRRSADARDVFRRLRHVRRPRCEMVGDSARNGACFPLG